jgi:hypothetical protein
VTVSPKRRRTPVVLIDSIARATEGSCVIETFEPLPARFMLGYRPVSCGRRVDMLEFNSCRHDCELPGGFCAMAMAIVFPVAMSHRD